MEDQLTIAAQFAIPITTATEIHPHGTGKVNDTFLVTTANARFILQRLSPLVFPRPDLVMHNLRVVTDHVRHRLTEPDLTRPPWRLAGIIPLRDGHDFFLAPDNSCWRMFSFLTGTHPLGRVRTSRQAEEAGFALGRFHRLISDLPPRSLYDTLPGFHITPHYLDHYDTVIKKATPLENDPASRYCQQCIDKRRHTVQVLESAKKTGLLQTRPIHGDPKTTNILVDDSSGRAVSMIDLDTVKPGLIHYDIGDCLRSCCNTAGEETGVRPELAVFDLDLCRAALTAYLDQARPLLSDHDLSYLYDAIRLITFELGLRFFTDYLEGNIYFKVDEPDQNLTRALRQFHLVQGIEKNEPAIRAMIEALSCPPPFFNRPAP